MNLIRTKILSCFFLAASLLCSAPAMSVLTIEVTKGVDSSFPIAIVPFGLEGLNTTIDNPAQVIESDLVVSGRFNALPREDFLSYPRDLSGVQYKDWRLLKAEYLVVGRVIDIGNGRFEVRFRLLNVYNERQMAGQKFVVPAKNMRKVAHQISDIVYQAITGTPGAFDTRISYVTVQGLDPDKRYLLQVADSDGYNPRTVLESREPILSPAWSPNGNQLAYVSFENQRSTIFIQDIWTGKRERISDHPGINSAPAWSPDGSRLALTLSKDGNTEIYVYEVATKHLIRLTRNSAIDTEPAWSPDGRTIAFTSGRSGAPQIYSMPSSGGPAQRLTFNGNYNAGPSYSSDGKKIVLITNHGNGYRVGVYSAEDRTVTELTTSHQDESPSFAPNGQMIIYATLLGGSNVLAAVSADGKVQQTLKFQDGSVREPSWSPFNHQ